AIESRIHLDALAVVTDDEHDLDRIMIRETGCHSRSFDLECVSIAAHRRHIRVDCCIVDYSMEDIHPPRTRSKGSCRDLRRGVAVIPQLNRHRLRHGLDRFSLAQAERAVNFKRLGDRVDLHGGPEGCEDFDLTWKGESGRAPWRRRAEKIVSHIIDSRAIGDYCTCPEPIAPCADDIQGILTGRWVRHFKELPGQRTRMLEDAV